MEKATITKAIKHYWIYRTPKVKFTCPDFLQNIWMLKKIRTLEEVFIIHEESYGEFFLSLQR